jgi:hypothetical protein
MGMKSGRHAQTGPHDHQGRRAAIHEHERVPDQHDIEEGEDGR